MPTPSPESYISAQNGAVKLALRDLRIIWERTSHLDALDRRKALEEFWPVLIERYGEITATLALDRFEEITGLSAVLPEPPSYEHANERLRWAVSPLFGGAGEVAAFALLEQLLDELVKQPGRDTLIENAARNDLRFARVPTGAETCSFCLMLASRGYVYQSEKSAEFHSSFHGGHCDCRIALEGEETPGYDPDALLEDYLNAREQADSGDPKKILAAMREQQGIN